MRIRIRPDPLIFGPPDPVLFSAEPEPDPNCNNGYIKYLHLQQSQNIKQNQQIQANSDGFMIRSRIRSRIRNIFPAEPVGKKCRILIPGSNKKSDLNLPRNRAP